MRQLISQSKSSRNGRLLMNADWPAACRTGRRLTGWAGPMRLLRPAAGKSRMFAGRPDAEAGRQLARACSGQSATQSTDSALGIVVSGPLFALLAQQSLGRARQAAPAADAADLLTC